jgi:hypothetical protein
MYVHQTLKSFEKVTLRRPNVLILSYGIFPVPERDHVLLSESCMTPVKTVHDVNMMSIQQRENVIVTKFLRRARQEPEEVDLHDANSWSGSFAKLRSSMEIHTKLVWHVNVSYYATRFPKAH